MSWILNKIGSLFTVAGIISMIFMGAANEVGLFNGCLIAGGVFAIIGLLVGGKLYVAGTSPVVLIFSSDNEIMDNIVFSSILWAVRMFFIPFIAMCLFKILTA